MFDKFHVNHRKIEGFLTFIPWQYSYSGIWSIERTLSRPYSYNVL